MYVFWFDIAQNPLNLPFFAIWQVSSEPPQNIEVLVHLVCRLIILKIVTENVNFADYQTKNAIREKIITLSQPTLDGDTTSEPF